MIDEKDEEFNCRVKSLALAHKMGMYMCADMYGGYHKIYELKNLTWKTIIRDDIFVIKAYLDRCWKLRTFC